MKMDLKSVSILTITCLLMLTGVQNQSSDDKSIEGKVANSTSQFLEDLLKFYDKHDPPLKNKPTEVKLGIYINSFHSINEQTMDYSISMYLRQNWVDPRLKYERSSVVQMGFGETIRLRDEMCNRVWLPDTFIRNEKKANFHGVTVDNRLLRLKPTGEIWYASKISATLSCPMILNKYPMDTQICPMMFESFGYTMDTLYFSWLETPVDVDADIQTPQFSLVSSVQLDCSQNYTSGSYPCLEINFFLRRYIGYFLLQIYFPTTLLVILSWLSFWINIESSSVRLILGFSNVVIITIVTMAIKSMMPRVAYMEALDVWMLACILFIFAALLEYLLLIVFSRKKGVVSLHSFSNLKFGHKVVEPKSSSCPEIQMVERGINGKCEPTEPVNLQCEARAKMIDTIASIGFPLAFLLFNIIYWITFSV